MLDERWTSDVEEVAIALRRMLQAKCTPAQVRAAEASPSGRDLQLERLLTDFGIDALDGEPELFARVAYELGRILVPTADVECMPALALTQRRGHALACDGFVPEAADHALVLKADGVYVQQTRGCRRRTSGGQLVVQLQEAMDTVQIGNADLGSRLERFSALVESARLVGAAQALLEYAIEYVKERQQFGRAIASYQAVAHRLARTAGELDAAELLLRKAAFAAKEDSGGDGAPPPHFAWMVQAKSMEAARFAATNVHQVFGGNGFSMEYDVQLYSRRIRAWALRLGRPGDHLAALARLTLDPERRDAMKLLWQHEIGLPIPRWAREADQIMNG